MKFDDVFESFNNPLYQDSGNDETLEEDRLIFEENFHAITDKQASKIAEFLKDHIEDTSLLICQCEKGQSRSAAVAAAANEFFCGNGDGVPENTPAKIIYDKVLKALRA